MNSHNFLDQEVALEVSLRRVLKNWAGRQKPPLSARTVIMRRAADPNSPTINRLVALQAYAQGRPNSGHAPFSLLYLHHLSFVSAWINF